MGISRFRDSGILGLRSFQVSNFLAVEKLVVPEGVLEGFMRILDILTNFVKPEEEYGSTPQMLQ